MVIMIIKIDKQKIVEAAENQIITITDEDVELLGL